jgi:hypothetical protein
MEAGARTGELVWAPASLWRGAMLRQNCKGAVEALYWKVVFRNTILQIGILDVYSLSWLRTLNTAIFFLVHWRS